MTQDLQEFKNWLKANNRSKNTINQRIGYIKKYFEKYDTINKDDIQSFLLSLQDNLSNGTINNYRKAIANYCEFKEIDIKIPKYLKTDDKLVDYITEEQFLNEILPILDYISEEPEKDKAILSMYFYTAIRKREILNLKRSQFDLKQGFLKVKREKTNIETEIAICSKLKEFLEIYFIIEEEETNAFNLTLGKLNGIFNKIKQEFPDLNFRANLLRHSFATMANDNEISILTLQDMMGHKSPNSTARYVNVTRKMKKEAIRKMFGDK